MMNSRPITSSSFTFFLKRASLNVLQPTCPPMLTTEPSPTFTVLAAVRSELYPSPVELTNDEPKELAELPTAVL